MPIPKKYQFKPTTEEPYGWLSPGLRESLSDTIDRITENNRKKEEAKQRAAEKEAFMGNTKKPNLVQSAVKAIKNIPRNSDEIFENTMANLGILSPANWFATAASTVYAGLGLIPGYQRDYDRIYLPTDKDNPRLHGLTGNPTVDEIAGLVTDFITPGVFEYAMASVPRVARGLNALERGVSKIGRRTPKPAQVPSQEFVTTATKAVPDFTYSYTGLPEDVAKGHVTFKNSYNDTKNILGNNYTIHKPLEGVKKDPHNLWSKIDSNEEYFGLGTNIDSHTFNNFYNRLLPGEENLISKSNNFYLSDAEVNMLNSRMAAIGKPIRLDPISGFTVLELPGKEIPIISISANQDYPSLLFNSSITANDIGNIISHEMAHKLMRYAKRFKKIYTWTADETAIHLGIDPQQARQALGDQKFEYLFSNGGDEIRARYTELKNNAGVREFKDTTHLRKTLADEIMYGIDNDKYTMQQLFNQSNSWDKLRDFGNVWAPMMTGAVFAEPFLKTNNSKTQSTITQ